MPSSGQSEARVLRTYHTASRLELGITRQKASRYYHDIKCSIRYSIMILKLYWFYYICPLRKHAYSNILKISPPKTEFSDKNSNPFHISAQNINC